MKDGLIRALSSYGPSSHEYVVMLNQYGAEVISSDFKIEYLSPFNQGFAMIMDLITKAVKQPYEFKKNRMIPTILKAANL